tara:strand:- start:678 stop:1025 length:348 start_codon:yes stop_codon:yes gene_type:complete
MIAQLLVLSHYIAAAPPVRLAATHPVTAVVADPRMCPFLPDVIEPVRDDFAVAPPEAFAMMHPGVPGVPFGIMHVQYTMADFFALFVENQVPLALLAYAIIVVAVFVPFEDWRQR